MAEDAQTFLKTNFPVGPGMPPEVKEFELKRQEEIKNSDIPFLPEYPSAH